MYLICSDVDLLRKPVARWTEGTSNVSCFHHLHQVSDDLGIRSNTCTQIIYYHQLFPHTIYCYAREQN